jgi:hypothetical protein
MTSAPAPNHASGTDAAPEADDQPAEGATSEQVLHAQDESRAEGEPDEEPS